MTNPFEEINFLTRSENRVLLLDTLAEGVYTERELVDRTDTSKVTVDRALDAFRERGWVREQGEGYTATPVGAVVAEDYARLSETMDVASHLGPVVDLLPVERMDFDLRILSEATISDPAELDVMQTVDRWITLIRESDRFEVLSYRAGRVIIEPIIEELEAGTLEAEAILPPSEVARIRNDPTIRESKQRMVRAGAIVYVAAEDQPKPYSLGLFDDVAAMVGWNEDSKPQVHVESRADPFVEWVEAEYEAAKADAKPLSPEDLEA